MSPPSPVYRFGRSLLGGVAPRVVMEILGHSQISITMDVYTHVVQDTQREAISHMDRLLKRRPGRE
jgi:integrase